MDSSEGNSVRPDDANTTEDTPGGPCNNQNNVDGGNNLSPKAVRVTSIRNPIDEKNSREDDDLGIHPIRQSYDNHSANGVPNNRGRNDYNFGHPPTRNEFHHLQFPSYYPPFVHGGPSNYGRNGYDFGIQPNRFQSYYNLPYQGGPSNGIDNNFGYPPNRNEFHHLQFPSYYPPFAHGGPSSYGWNGCDFGNQPNRNGSGQFYSKDVRNSHYDRCGNERHNSDFSVPFNSADYRQKSSSALSGDQEGGNSNKQQDADSKIEHHKLKRRITDLYKSKSPLGFAKNSANFDKDEWVQVWYIGTEGFKLYQSQINCPLCFKKLTPQNRAGSGKLPLWELTPVKGHLAKLHFEGKSVQQDDAPGKEAERNEMTDNVPSIQATDEEDVEDSSVDNSDVLQPLPPSSPESKSSSLTPSPSRSPLLQSDAPSDSTEADEAIDLPKKRRVTRKTNSKRVEGDAAIKRKRQECLDWRKPGVEFAWVKFTSSSRFLPAFVFPMEKGKQKRLARQILIKGGELEEKKHEVSTIATPLQVEQTKKLPKTKPYLAALKQFNSNHNTNFQ